MKTKRGEDHLNALFGMWQRHKIKKTFIVHGFGMWQKQKKKKNHQTSLKVPKWNQIYKTHININKKG
jgi:hypothetical protein